MMVLSLAALQLISTQKPISDLRPPTVGALVDGKRKVTFRFRSEELEQAYLVLDPTQPIKMRPIPDGPWAIETDPLPPGIYVYRFYQNNKGVHDESNPLRKPIHGGGFESVLEVSGTEPQPWSQPKGKLASIQTLELNSEVFGEKRKALVYQPKNTPNNSPVMFLLHGAMENEAAWTTAGRAHYILENLIRTKKLKPMTLVMPLGYGFSNSEKNVTKVFAMTPNQHRDSFEKFKKHLMTELLPQVETQFKTSKKRAITGVSMGGAQAVYIGLNEPDQFQYVGSFGGAMLIYGSLFEPWFSNHPAQKPQLFLRCGDKDFVKPSNDLFRKWLDNNQIPYHWETKPGGHTWQVWNDDLVAFMEKALKTLSR